MQDSASNVIDFYGCMSTEEKKLRWKIDNFDQISSNENLLKQQSIDYEFKGSNGVKYKATVSMSYAEANPNDNYDGEEEKILPTIELHVSLEKLDKPGKPEFEAQCSVIAEDAGGKEIFAGAPHSDLTFLSRNGYVWNLLTDSENRNVVRALTIIVTFKIYTVKHTTVIGSNYKYPEAWKQEICSKIAKLENDEKNSDVKIVSAEGHEFFAYRWILSEFSDVFEAMFRSNMLETETGVVKLDDVSGKTLGLMLHFIYAGEIGNEWSSPDVVEELIQAADKYQIKHLSNFLNANLGKICTIENAGNLLALSEQTSLKKAAMDIFAFLQKQVNDSQKYLEFMKNTTAFN